MWDLWWTKWRWGGFSPIISVSPLIAPQSSSIWGWYIRPNSDHYSASPHEKIVKINNNNNGLFVSSFSIFLS
jgi:hypothetical protein